LQCLSCFRVILHLLDKLKELVPRLESTTPNERNVPLELDPDLKYVINEEEWTRHMKAANHIMAEYNQKLKSVIEESNNNSSSDQKTHKRVFKNREEDPKALLNQEYREIFHSGRKNYKMKYN
jgi:hypothetical protein